MSKKHFQKLAYELWLRKPHEKASEDEHMTWERCVGAVAHACEQLSGTFNRERFIAACHLDKYTPAEHGR